MWAFGLWFLKATVESKAKDQKPKANTKKNECINPPRKRYCSQVAGERGKTFLWSCDGFD